MTDVERILWRALREANLPHRIRRQHPIGRYIADITIPTCKLAIELDGGQHADNARADARRTEELERRHYRVIRFWNNEVLENLDGVLQTIVAEVEKSHPTSP
jgi:crossover junction endodeoxyribonuclease RuvC